MNWTQRSSIAWYSDCRRYHVQKMPDHNYATAWTEPDGTNGNMPILLGSLSGADPVAFAKALCERHKARAKAEPIWTECAEGARSACGHYLITLPEPHIAEMWELIQHQQLGVMFAEHAMARAKEFCRQHANAHVEFTLSEDASHVIRASLPDANPQTATGEDLDLIAPGRLPGESDADLRETLGFRTGLPVAPAYFSWRQRFTNWRARRRAAKAQAKTTGYNKWTDDTLGWP